MKGECPQNKQIIYRARTGRGVSHPHAARSPLILCFLAVSKGSHSTWTSKDRPGPGTGEFPGVALVTLHLQVGVPPNKTGRYSILGC